jgi:hypothetical protein
VFDDDFCLVSKIAISISQTPILRPFLVAFVVISIDAEEPTPGGGPIGLVLPEKVE